MFGILLSIASTVVGALSSLGLAIEGLKLVGNLLMGIAKALGIIKPETEVDELGDKALQAEEEGIRPENFETYEDYVKAIEGFKVDPEKSELYTEEEKINKGIEVTSTLTAEKYPDLDVESLAIAIADSPEFFNSKVVEKLGDMLKNGTDSIDNILRYIDGSEKNIGRIDTAIDDLKNIYKSANPEVSDNMAEDMAIRLRR